MCANFISYVRSKSNVYLFFLVCSIIIIILINLENDERERLTRATVQLRL